MMLSVSSFRSNSSLSNCSGNACISRDMECKPDSSQESESCSQSFDPFVCFIIFKENKFDIVISDAEPIDNRRFFEVYEKIKAIFSLALKQKIAIQMTIFELLDAATSKWKIIRDFYEEIRHLSVITIHEKPVPLSRGRALKNDLDIQFLQRRSQDIIAFYLMVKQFDPNKNFRKNKESKWKGLSCKVKATYPELFTNYTPKMCQHLFDSLTLFYCLQYYGLNLKLDAKLQRTFNLLKIVHTLDPKKVFSKTKTIEVKNIAEHKERLYVHCLRKYSYDIYVNEYSNCMNVLRLNEYIKNG